MEGCSFCSEIKKEEDNNLFLSLIKPQINLESRVLYESDNFQLIPTIGSFIEGYLLLITKKHYVCIGECPEDYYSEISNLIKGIRKYFEEKYNIGIVVFEHGAASKFNRGGCCVDHAHLHLIPFDQSILDDITEKGLRIEAIESFHALNRLYTSNNPYLYYEDGSGYKFVITGEVIPSQFLRQIVSKKINKLDLWDWRKNHCVENIITTITGFNKTEFVSYL